MISAVVLNWSRPANGDRIVDGFRRDGFVREAIVWNNRPDAPYRHAWAKVVNAAPDLGLYTRFAAASLATHECVLIQDDDLELPLPTLRALFDAWARDPAPIHGIFGRAPRPDGGYDFAEVDGGEAPVVLTRALVASRRYAAAFFRDASRFEAIQRDSRPSGNGEDIIFSYSVMRRTGRLNRIHHLPVHELPSPDPIHRRDAAAHLEHRGRLMRACEAWLAGRLDTPRRDAPSAQSPASP